MDKGFQEILAERFRGLPRQLAIVKNVDGFLLQPEVKSLLELNSIRIFDGSNFTFRLFYELEFKPGKCRDEKILYLANKPDAVLEDIADAACFEAFHLEYYFPEFHLAVISECHLDLLDFLFAHKPLHRLDKRQTLKYILEQYYGIDADNFSSKEIVLCKWLEFYQKDIPIDPPVKAYFQELSARQVEEAAIATKASLTSYIQNEWQKCADGQATALDFRYPPLQNALSAYFFKSWLNPLEDTSGRCREVGIPYAIRQSTEGYSAEAIVKPLEELISRKEPLDWSEVAITAGQAILRALGAGQFSAISPLLQSLNHRFQAHLDASYRDHILPSNPFKRPKVVSKALPHLKANHSISDKLALLVIDGMAFWQYLLLKNAIVDFPFKIEEHLIYSWIPSVTYLSRQAIFRGGAPDANYIQNPANERKLWEDYWSGNDIPASMIRYDYQQIALNGLQNITRLAAVYTELDEKMHSSSDYQDLYGLTQNWIARSKIAAQIQHLLDHQFTVYLTTDHGNLEAMGWRNLKGTEKFGAGKSRSRRHLEYAESWLADEFLANNPDLTEATGREGNTLYLRDNRSFSSQESEVTHGGSHFLEVLIPFVKISK